MIVAINMKYQSADHLRESGWLRQDRYMGNIPKRICNERDN